MEIADFNPIIFTISLGIGFVFWKIAKMSAEKNSTFENRKYKTDFALLRCHFKSVFACIYHVVLAIKTTQA